MKFLIVFGVQRVLYTAFTRQLRRVHEPLCGSYNFEKEKNHLNTGFICVCIKTFKHDYFRSLMGFTKRYPTYASEQVPRSDVNDVSMVLIENNTKTRTVVLRTRTQKDVRQTPTINSDRKIRIYKYVDIVVQVFVVPSK